MTAATTTTSAAQDDRATYEILVNVETKGLQTSTLNAIRQRLIHDDDHSTPTAAADDDAAEMGVLTKIPHGARHIQACVGMLRITKNVATQLTIQALRKLKVIDDVNVLRSLVGAPTLVLAVRDVYYDQRIARLQVMAEVLRIDQDGEHMLNDACRVFLDSELGTLDKLEELFRQLLNRATVSPSESHLFSSEAFFGHRDECVNEMRYDWDAFYRDLKESSEAQCVRERSESLEALIVLLFSRLDISSAKQCSLGRGSLMLLDLLSAFIKVNFYVEDTKSSTSGISRVDFALCGVKRLPKLATLLCVEAMGLWRTNSVDSCWWKEHSFLNDLSEFNLDESKRVQVENIFSTLGDALQHVSARRDNVYSSLKLTEYDEKVDRNIEKPEALVLLSFGLLLRLGISQNSTDRNELEAILNQLEASPNLILENANDVGAFDYFSELLNVLVADDSFIVKHEIQVEDNRNENAIYASISREVLSASLQSTYVFNYNDSNHFMNISDLKMFCDLVYNIHKNQPELCRSFWMFWEGSYCQQNLLSHGDSISISSELLPLCKLLDMSFKVASSCDQQHMVVDALSYLSPLFRFLTGCICDQDTAVCALAVVQDKILPSSILGVMQQLFPGESISTRSSLVVSGQILGTGDSTYAVVEFLDKLAIR